MQRHCKMVQQALAKADYRATLAVSQALRGRPATLLRACSWLYELYVIGGMCVALLQIVWGTEGGLAGVQFHLLPHLVTYSVFRVLKSSVRRGRPGCARRRVFRAIDPGHCRGGLRWQSFPSAHAGIAFSLLTALALEVRVNNSVFGVDVGVAAGDAIIVAGVTITCGPSIRGLSL